MSALRPHRSPLLTHSASVPASRLLGAVSVRSVVSCRRHRICTQWRCPAPAMAAADAEQFELLVTSTDADGLKELQQRLVQESITLSTGSTAAPVYQPDSMQTRPRFDASAFMRQLATERLGRTILSAARLPSTQALLQSNARLFPSGTACIADVQVQGKGRGGNTWTSPPGCLMFSVVMRLDISGTRLPFIQYVVSLAVLQAIQSEAGKLLGDGNRPLDVHIKWPNDLYAGAHKLGGILCQTVYRDQQFQVVVGVGLNVSNEEPSTCIAALLLEEQKRHGSRPLDSSTFSPEALLASILSILERHVHALQTEGFGPLEAAYTSNWLHNGQQVTLKGGAGEGDISVRIQGLTPDGYLLATDDQGERYSLSPDGNSLDFFKGLVKAKLPST